MMNRRIVLGFLLGICGILWLLFLHGNDYTELVFSRESGFYDEPFELEMHSPVGTEIYYTLDGSDPDENAIQYTEPITINDATLQENVYSMRTDVAPDFLLEPTPIYRLPDYPIDKCTVVKAAYRDADGNYSKIKSASYFVGYQDKTGYDKMNIISIITDPDNLFDFDSGIYVLGEIDEEDYQKNGIFWVDANYYQHGIDWERNASIQFYDTEKHLALDQDCGIRIQGGYTRSSLPRSLNLYAREQYSNNARRFYIDLFGTGYMADTVTLFAGGNDRISKCRDMLVSRLVADRNFATMNYVPYAMFLDGEYWGIYWLTEKYDDVYLAHYFDVDKDNVIMIKANSLAEGEEADVITYQEAMGYMVYMDLSIVENYQYACNLIDIQSYIDYYATEIYIGHVSDWPLANEAVWRVREAGDKEYEDGKWRWVLFDVNTTLVSDSVAEDTLSITMEQSAMFNNLCQNEEFKRQFVITFMDLANTCFAKDNVDPVISECVQQMEEPMKNHLKRFFGDTMGSNTFPAAIAEIQHFFDDRSTYITRYLKDDFGLTGTLVSVTVEINDTSAGSVIVNTANITFDENCSWCGEYYTDYPITLTAVANDGYRFVGWEKDSSSESSNIELTLDDNGTFVKAVFEVDM